MLNKYWTLFSHSIELVDNRDQLFLLDFCERALIFLTLLCTAWK
jgi:hypothetical protein